MLPLPLITQIYRTNFPEAKRGKILAIASMLRGCIGIAFAWKAGQWIDSDINNFKLINDSYGHIAGDFIIQEISKRLKSCIRKEDICARVGGDEFACLIKDLQNYKNLAQ